jgi:hypothetical protein
MSDKVAILEGECDLTEDIAPGAQTQTCGESRRRPDRQ